MVSFSTIISQWKLNAENLTTRKSKLPRADPNILFASHIFMVSQHQNIKPLHFKSILDWIKTRLKYNGFYSDTPPLETKEEKEWWN